MSTPAVTPDQSQQAPQPDQSQAPHPQAQPQAPAQQPGSKWSNVVKGALIGLTSNGVPGAIAGATNPGLAQERLAQQRQRAQGAIDMQKAQSANLLSEAALRHTQMEQLPKELEMRARQQDEQQANTYIQRGISPAVVTHDQSAESAMTAAKQVLDDSRHVVVLRMGDGYAAFDLNALGAQPGVLSDVNAMRLVRGSQPIESATWNNKTLLNPGSKSKLVADSATFFNPVPGKSLGEVDGQLSAYKNYLTTAQTVPDSQFPDKAKRVQQLQTVVDVLQGQHDKLEKEADIQMGRNIKTSKARGAAYNMTKVIKVTGDNGKVTYQFAGDAVKGGAAAPETWKSVEPYVKTADDAEKSYSMFQDAYRDFQAGTKTGAQSMLALSQHLATTFGGVKGNRITKEMIQQHLGARSVGDSALVATQKLTNGDELSPAQWDAFRELIGQSRRYSWGVATKNASAKGINIRDLVPKDLGGAGQISNPAQNIRKPAGAPAQETTSAQSDPFAQFGGQRRQ